MTHRVRADHDGVVTNNAQHANAKHLSREPDRTIQADLDLILQLVCSCDEDNCERREVVHRVIGRVGRTAEQAHLWAKEAVQRDTPEQPDTIFTGGAGDIILTFLGAERRPIA